LKNSFIISPVLLFNYHTPSGFYYPVTSVNMNKQSNYRAKLWLLNNTVELDIKYCHPPVHPRIMYFLYT
jgi:hypothetical protein